LETLCTFEGYAEVFERPGGGEHLAKGALNHESRDARISEQDDGSCSVKIGAG